MLAIDLRTLFLFLLIGNVFTIIFFRIYIYFYHARIRKLNKYAIARFLQSITWLIYFMNVRNLDPITMAVSTIPIAFGIALEVYSLLTSTSAFVKKKFITLFCIAIAYSISYFIFSSNLIYRVIIASTFICSFYTYVWIDFSLRKGRSKMQRAAGWIGFLLGILFLSRALHTYLLNEELLVNSQRYFNVLAGFGLVIVAFAWPLIFLLLHKEQDEYIILEKDKQILRQNRRLLAYGAAKDKLIRIISHDLRAPMTSMINFLDLIEDEVKQKDLPTVQTYTNLVSQSAHETINLLDNLLHWSALQSGKDDVVLNPVYFQRLIEQITNLFQISLSNKKIELDLEIEPELVFVSDKRMLETSLRNLISNAIKFTNPNGKISVKAHQDKHFIIIEVADNGVGISPENIKKLFKTQTNFSSEGTNKEQGTGLGLMLSNEFVKKLDGKIAVESELGKGTTFQITLPIKTQ